MKATSISGAISLTLLYSSHARVVWAQQEFPSPKSQADVWNWNSVNASRTLEYHQCYGYLECARLEVPLDWTNLSNPNYIQLAIARLPAKVNISDESFGGTILLNPGGPSGSGIDFVRFGGQAIQDIVDSDKHYEIISFDPRGTKYTTPSTSCFDSDAARILIYLQTAASGTVGSSSNALNMHWASAEARSQLCATTNQGVYPDGSNIRQYVSTALVAYDMLEIIDQVEEHRQSQLNLLSRDIEPKQSVFMAHPEKKNEPPLLNYWGFSYGTLLGNTFASMFPNRIGRMVLDAVVDADDYMASGWTTNLQDNNKTWEKFFEYCYEGGIKCPLYDRSFTSPADIRILVETFVEHLKHNPMPIVFNSNAYLFTHYNLAAQMHVASYSPNQLWQLFALGLAGLIQGGVQNDMSSFTNLNARKSTRQHPFLQPMASFLEAYYNESDTDDVLYSHQVEAMYSILCGDGEDLTSLGKPGYLKYVRQLLGQSPYIGDIWAELTLTCFHWPKSLRPEKRNRFVGPFATNLSDYDPRSSPLLFIGNTADPVTPVRNAYRMAAKHEGAVVLVQDSPGHCTAFINPSTCTFGAIKEFFANGKLPKQNMVCQGDNRPWKD